MGIGISDTDSRRVLAAKAAACLMLMPLTAVVALTLYGVVGLAELLRGLPGEVRTFRAWWREAKP